MPAKRITKKKSSKKSSPKAFSNIVKAPAKKKNTSRSLTRTPSKKSKAKRRYFTVREDWTIISFIKKHPELKATSAAKKLGNMLNRSSESIRDRAKRYLTKISAKDQKKIQTAAKVRNQSLNP